MDDATSTELPKIRRAALGLSLVAAVLLSAGVAIDREAAIPLFGLRVTLARADLIPLAVVVGAIYCGARYWYYGHMLLKSPYRTRRDLLDRLRGPKGVEALSYAGPAALKSRWSFENWTDAADNARKIQRAWPRFLRASTTATVEEDGADEMGGMESNYRVVATVPARCRFAALFEDLDYATPVLAPIAVAMWYWWPW